VHDNPSMHTLERDGRGSALVGGAATHFSFQGDDGFAPFRAQLIAIKGFAGGTRVRRERLRSCPWLGEHQEGRARDRSCDAGADPLAS
jgi:hypothetical protein